MSAHQSIVALVSAFNEEDIIGEVIGALVQEGVQVYVIDNHSTDGTRSQVEAFIGRGVIGIETFPPERPADDAFAWAGILRRKEELAQSIAADWFIHSDADEFRESPWPNETLQAGVERAAAAGYNAIDFEVLNFVPTTGDPPAGSVRDRLVYHEPGQAFDRRQIKCWKRTDERVDLVSSGGHSVQFAGRHVCPIRFLLRHYPIRSQAHGERKVFRERLGRFSEEERNKGWHVQYDTLRAEMTFVKNPADYTRYDPDRVRLDLLLRTRDAERLQQALAVTSAEADRLARTVDRQATRLAEVEQTLAGMTQSISWKITGPLRRLDRLIRKR